MKDRDTSAVVNEIWMRLQFWQMIYAWVKKNLHQSWSCRSSQLTRVDNFNQDPSRFPTKSQQTSFKTISTNFWILTSIHELTRSLNFFSSTIKLRFVTARVWVKMRQFCCTEMGHEQGVSSSLKIQNESENWLRNRRWPNLWCRSYWRYGCAFRFPLKLCN